MIEGIATSVAKLLELAPRYLAVVAIASGIVLYAPNGALVGLGLDQLAKDQRPWIGGTFLVSCVLSIVSLIIWAQDKLFSGRRDARQIERLKEAATKRLHSLTEDEKKILRFYIAQGTRSNVLNIEDGVVQGLVATGIIRQAAVIGIGTGFAHNISEFAWEYLNEHPEILIGFTDDIRTDQRIGLW